MTLFKCLFFLTAIRIAHSYDVRQVSSAINSALSTEVLPAAQFSVPFANKIPRPTYKKNLLKGLRGLGDVPTAVVAGSDYDELYVVNMTVGGQNFAVLVDTGS